MKIYLKILSFLKIKILFLIISIIPLFTYTSLTSYGQCPTVGFYTEMGHIPIDSLPPVNCTAAEFWIIAYEVNDAQGFVKPGVTFEIITDGSSEWEDSLKILVDGNIYGGYAPLPNPGWPFYGGPVANNTTLYFYMVGARPNSVYTFKWCDNASTGAFPYRLFDHADVINDDHFYNYIISTPVLAGTFNHPPLCFEIQLNSLKGIATFSGPGITDDIGSGKAKFSAALAGPGIHTIEYCWDDQKGCSTCVTQQITVEPTVSINPHDLAYCFNDSSTVLTGNPPGGIFGGQGIVDSIFNPASAGVGTHIISYAYTDSYGCSDTAQTTLIVHSLPDITITPTSDSVCIGGSATLTALNAIDFIWSTTDTVSQITVYPTIGTTYYVTGTDINGCSGTASATVFIKPNNNATISPQGPFCANDDTTSFQAVDGGGTWSGNGISSDGLFNPAVAGPGEHTITYVITGPCGDIDSIVVRVFSVPQISLNPKPEICSGANDGWISAKATGGKPPYYYLWNTNSSSDTISNLGPGDYSVTVTDANGCYNTIDIYLGDSGVDCPDPHVRVPNVFEPNGDGDNDILYVYGRGIEHLEFVIFNRWGEKVFKTNNKKDGWDGTFRGQPLNPAVFVYFLKAKLSDDRTVSQYGDITLIR